MFPYLTSDADLILSPLPPTPFPSFHTLVLVLINGCFSSKTDPDLGPGCWGVLRVVAVSHVSPVGGTAAPATISEITTGRAQHPRGGRAGVREASPRSMGQELERPQQWHSSGTGHCGGTADGAPGPSLRALRGQARLWEPRPLE